jgi:hypothetical protein
MDNNDDWVEYRSSLGHAYYLREPRVPRIFDEFIASVFYLYPSQDAAEQGRSAGGTGFLTSISSTTDPREKYTYAVTNKHLIDDIYPVIRLNTKEGGIDYLPADQSSWTISVDDDLAILEISLNENHAYYAIPEEYYLTEKEVEEYDIGAGDDVYMIGRFVNRDGVLRNTPSARFGNISIMGGEDVEHRLGHLQENISVEMRSIGGYSGSPVFVYLPPLSIRPKRDPRSTALRQWLLGVDWGHVPQRLPVKLKTGMDHPEGCFVESHTAMANVVPAWRLREMLDVPTFFHRRRTRDDEIAEELRLGTRSPPDTLD